MPIPRTSPDSSSAWSGAGCPRSSRRGDRSEPPSEDRSGCVSRRAPSHRAEIQASVHGSCACPVKRNPTRATRNISGRASPTIGPSIRDSNRPSSASQSAGPSPNWISCRVVRRSWELNCALDAGTNPPEVRQILARVADWTAAAKLPGAGGGGYVFLLAKDVEAAARIRQELTDRPPNPRARFVKMKISPTGFQVTRS
ncbi:MAG: hypothetical protein DVB31_16840 [Verrucomicrobia bacterium]|nr:MAG: hypothetical protein DVB31_16840 [Verrucomicrobiota bacterium]